MMKKTYYLLAFTVPLSILISFVCRGPWSYFSFIYTFGLIPFLELFLPKLSRNLSVEQEILWKQDLYFNFILWLMVPFQYALLFYFCSVLGTQALKTYEIVGLISAMGIGCGVLGINVAHELGHKNNRFEKSLAKILLSSTLYWHFFIEHNRGHHKNVSTPLDPESSRFNENLYAFLPRSIICSFLSALRIDPKQMIFALSVQSILPISIFILWGHTALFSFLASALLGILLLETVNYIEHYGLVRREISPHVFEKVQPHHSWNADNLLSRTILFDLSRHSDHHANVVRKYQNLRHDNSSPQMPTGYPGMILLSLIPPLWFKVMNSRIKAMKIPQ